MTISRPTGPRFDACRALFSGVQMHAVAMRGHCWEGSLCAFTTVAVNDHAIVEGLDAIASSAFEQKREKSVQQASNPRDDHACAKAESHAHVLEIRLANTGWMLGKRPLDHRLSPFSLMAAIIG